MEFTLMMSGFLLMVSSSVCVDFTARGTEGEQVTIKCPYPGGYENSYKYFYKGRYRDRNLLLQSDGRQSSVDKDRFSLQDDHQTRSFTLTIRNLRMTDAGLYCCGAGYGEYKLIQLNVIKAPQKTPPVQISTSTLQLCTNPTNHTSTVTPQTEGEATRTTTGSTTDQLFQPTSNLLSVSGGLGLVLLILVLLVLVLCSGTFIFLKKMKRKSGTDLFQQNVQHNTESEHMYDEITSSDVIATSSSNRIHASHLNTRPKVSTVYATVTNQQLDTNPSRTQSTNQVTDTDCDYYISLNSPEPTSDRRTEVIYSTVTHPQNIKTNDNPIYSAIKHE